MPRISSKEAIRALERLGFEQVRQTGSHISTISKNNNAIAFFCLAQILMMPKCDRYLMTFL